MSLRHYRLLAAFCMLLSAGFAHPHPGVKSRLDYLHQRIAAQPSQQLYLQRASAYLEAQDYAAASADLDIAATLGEPDEGCYLQGLLASARGEPRRAVGLFSCYLQLHPLAYRLLQERAKAWQLAGEPESALRDYRQYLQLAEAPQPGQFLAAAELALQLADTQLALAILDQGSARIGINTTLQRRAIDIEIGSSDFEAAIARQLSLRQPMHNSLLWQLQMAELYLQAGDHGRARAALDACGLQLQHSATTVAMQRLQQRAAFLRRQLGGGY